MPVWDALKWANQKIGDFFGDFKEDRELAKEPGVCRDITRLACLLCLVCGFVYAFYRFFIDAPTVEVNRVYLQNKEANYAIDRLYSSSASYGTDIDAVNNSSGRGSGFVIAEQEVLDCPCTNTTFSWTNFVHFYIVNYTSPTPVMNWQVSNDTGVDKLELRSVSAESVTLDSRNLFRDPVDLTTEKFCTNLNLWPRRFEYGERRQLDCPALVSALLSSTPLNTEIPSGADRIVGSTNWNDPRASFFESSSLQNQKFLYSNTIRRLRAYQQGQFTLLNSMRPIETDNATYRAMFLTGMTDLWLYALDRFGANSSSTDLQFFQVAASRSFATFNELQRFWPDVFAVKLYEGQSFLGMNINWTEYYISCGPAFCDVTTKSSLFHRAYTALALVGGLWGVAVVAVTLLVWPVTAFLLVRFLACCTSQVNPLRKASSRALARTPSSYKKLETPMSTDEMLEANL